MDVVDFSEEVEELFQNKDYDKLIEIIFNPENQRKVQAFGMDLITRICECGLAFCAESDSLTACQDMLMHVVRSVRPKEALISLLEQAEIFVSYDSSKFSSLLAPLQHVMMNLPKKREHSFSWVLSILNSHMKSRHKFPVKYRSRFIQGKDALLIEADKEIRDLIQTYQWYCNFYEPFVHQFLLERNSALLSNDSTAISSINRQQSILRDHLVQLLGDPLLHLDLHWEEPTKKRPPTVKDLSSFPSVNNNEESNTTPIVKTDARLISERLMGFLRIVDPYPEYYLAWSARKIFLEKSKLKNKPVYCGEDESDDADSDEFFVEFSSVVNYYYLIFVEGLNSSMIPSILSPSHVFISTTRLMLNILRNDKAGPISLLKCLNLSSILLDKIDENVPDIRLECELLETADAMDFIESVAYHTVYCETLEVRKQGLQVLKQMMWKFEPRGRYDYILFVLNRIEHDGVKGYIITQLKDCIRSALDTENKEMLDLFTGKFLQKQLNLTCKLKNGVTTDIMDNKETIMSALNLVLYLAIRDKALKSTGFAEVLPDIEKKLLEPLFKGLELSRAHYRLKLKELEDDPKKVLEEQLEEQKKISEKMDLLVNDALTLEQTKASIEDQKCALNSALGMFDIMNGTLARVNELCDSFKKSSKNH